MSISVSDLKVYLLGEYYSPKYPSCISYEYEKKQMNVMDF